MEDRPFLYPYFDKNIFNERTLESIIGDNTPESIRAFINSDDSYEKDTLFYTGLFKAQPLKHLIKTVYGIFLFEDNYHDFTDTNRVDAKGLLYPSLDKNVDAFYLNVIKYTTEEWFFDLYLRADKVINKNKKGDRKEDTLIRLFQTNGGEQLWEAIFEENPIAVKLLTYFFIDKVFLGNVPVVRKISKANIDTLNVNSIKHDFFFEFTLDKHGLTPKQRNNFTMMFRNILDSSLYGTSIIKEKTNVTCDATSFPYKYTGINEFADNFKPHASAQTLWDGASMDTFGGRLEYDKTSNLPKEAKELQSVRSRHWDIQFDKKKDDVKDSEYNIIMKYNNTGDKPASLNTTYSLSSGKKGFTITHMFEHAVYIKYCIDYKLKPSEALFTHITKLYTLLVKQAAAAAAAKKTKNMILPPIISPANVINIDISKLYAYLMIPVDGKGSCDADQAIYASYRRYGFTSLDALSYFSGILNRANSAYVVSTIGRIRAAKFMRDQRTLDEQKQLLEINKIAIKFKELVNIYIRVRHFIDSIVKSYKLLFSREVYYKNDPAIRSTLGNIFKAMFLYKLHANKEKIIQLRLADASYLILTKILESMAQFIPGVNVISKRTVTLHTNIDAIFAAMQKNDLFMSPIPHLVYVIYEKIRRDQTIDIKPEGEATYADLFNNMYDVVEDYISNIRGQLMYKKGKDEYINIDTFNVVQLVPGHGPLAQTQYLVIDNKKYTIIDNEGHFKIDGVLESIELFEVNLKALSLHPELLFNRNLQRISENILSHLNDRLNLEIAIDYSRLNTSDAIELINNAANNVINTIVSDTQGLFASGILPLKDQQIGGSSRGQVSVINPYIMSASKKIYESAKKSSADKSENIMEYLVNNLEIIASNTRLRHTIYGASSKYLIAFIFTVLLIEDQIGGASGISIGGSGVSKSPSGTKVEHYNDIVNLFQEVNNIISYNLHEYTNTSTDTRDEIDLLQSRHIILITDLNDKLNSINEYKQIISRTIFKGYSINDIMQYMITLVSNPCANDAIGTKFMQSYLYDIDDINITTQDEFTNACITHFKILDRLLKCIKFEICNAPTSDSNTDQEIQIVGIKRKRSLRSPPRSQSSQSSQSNTNNSLNRTVKRPRSKLRINNKA
jgi:hypothetical protein